MTSSSRCPPRVAAGRQRLSAASQTKRLALLDAFMGYVTAFLAHDRPRPGMRALVGNPARLRVRSRRAPAGAGLLFLRDAGSTTTTTTSPAPHSSALPTMASSRRFFHNYFVTHLPSSSLHPDSRHLTVPHHKLPRSASVPHIPGPPGHSTPLPAAAAPTNVSSLSAPLTSVTAASTPGGGGGVGGGGGGGNSLGRDLTVVRIPLRSAKHHFGAYNARGSRAYNEDTNQAGTINLPAFAQRAPISLVQSAISNSRSTGEGITADSASGDPQIFYFGVFDGHGGTECSDFLRDELAGYIETAATEFGLTSSLRRKETRGLGGGGRTRSFATAALAASTSAGAGAEGKVAEDAGMHSGGSSKTKATELQRELLQEYRDTVGGYFRRFKPPSFADGIVPKVRSSLPSSSSSSSTAPTDPVTLESVLTYAFLRADLDFITAQVRKPDPDDPYVADFPLNQDEILGAPHHLPPSGLGIGGPVRFKGGSTASVALISTPTPAPFWHPAARAALVVAHVGDTRVLLCDTATGQARPLTRDHHPASPVEARRLTRFAESLVTDSFGESRILGLANSRAFGDMQSKRLGVSAEPELTRVALGPAQYAFLVLVSDGVSGTLSDQEIVDVVKEARTPEEGARAVVEYATEVSRDGDNATCLVVRLGGWERRSEGGLGALGTKELRDARRVEANDPRRGRQ